MSAIDGFFSEVDAKLHVHMSNVFCASPLFLKMTVAIPLLLPLESWASEHSLIGPTVVTKSSYVPAVRKEDESIDPK
jgi:hypothetical protein